MKKQEYNELMEKVFSLILSANDDAKLKERIKDEVIVNFRKISKCRSTIRTLKGIIGFHSWCEENNEKKEFLFNALHDLMECNNDYPDSGFVPRLASFVDYQPSKVNIPPVIEPFHEFAKLLGEELDRYDLKGNIVGSVECTEDNIINLFNSQSEDNTTYGTVYRYAIYKG